MCGVDIRWLFCEVNVNVCVFVCACCVNVCRFVLRGEEERVSRIVKLSFSGA